MDSKSVLVASLSKPVSRSVYLMTSPSNACVLVSTFYYLQCVATSLPYHHSVDFGYCHLTVPPFCIVPWLIGRGYTTTSYSYLVPNSLLGVRLSLVPDTAMQRALWVSTGKDSRKTRFLHEELSRGGRHLLRPLKVDYTQRVALRVIITTPGLVCDM